MFLGIDVGTSGVKAVLVNEAGAIVATASQFLALSHPAPLFSEQDPDAWADAAIAAVDSLAAAHPRETEQVRGIGLSGQMHGATLLGADGRPLRPAILWNDGALMPSAPNSNGYAPRCMRSRAILRCPVSPHPSCYGWRDTSRKCLQSWPRYCCPRPMSATA